MSYTSELQALRQDIATLRQRFEDHDRNDIEHENRILNMLKRAGMTEEGETPNTPPVTPSKPPDADPTPPQPTERAGLAEVRGTMQNMNLQTAASYLENTWNNSFRDAWKVDNICLVINERWPSEWRNLPQRVSGIIAGQLHALGGQGV